ncbi:MAG: glycosyltransferase family 29 protein [Paracoccaceae bacterium]
MTRLGFLIARTLRNETALSAMGLSMHEVLARLQGRVALVGNARSLEQRDYGAEIDGADLIIRINRAPMPNAASHGTRTDVLALAVGIDSASVQQLNPALTLWMSHKRKRLPWHVATRAGFALPPRVAFERLRAQLGAPPTTGLLMIDLLERSPATQITLYGFDFFASQSLTGSRTAAQVPHDFAAERAFAEGVTARDTRFALRP